ncbi:MAG TPA: alpha/beta hydrolase [Smithellaceae bacterium]|nr:alpha/beta hydrolase [Smithellaceae bacterium]HQH00108.1 alpha/beta hydrolase [Smithellaceae bacterium]
MLHGWPESSYCWEGVTEFLDPQWRVIAPDLRGLGDSERTLDVKAYQKVELAKDVIEIINALGIQDFFLAGHDWGGIVAQEMAFLIPDRIKKFVILNIPVLTNVKGAEEVTKAMIAMRYLPYWYQYFQMMPGLPEAMIRGKEREWVSFFFGKKGRDGTIPREAIDEYVRCYSIENTPATGASYYRSMSLDAPHWAGLAGKRFSMPSLYIYGNEDSVIIPANIAHLEDCFDSIQIEQIKAAHFVQEEKPGEVARLMNDFFK